MGQDDRYKPSNEVPSSEGTLCSLKVTITSPRKKRRQKEHEEGRGERRRGEKSRTEEESGREEKESRNHLGSCSSGHLPATLQQFVVPPTSSLARWPACSNITPRRSFSVHHFCLSSSILHLYLEKALLKKALPPRGASQRPIRRPHGMWKTQLRSQFQGR